MHLSCPLRPCAAATKPSLSYAVSTKLPKLSNAIIICLFTFGFVVAAFSVIGMSSRHELVTCSDIFRKALWWIRLFEVFDFAFFMIAFGILLIKIEASKSAAGISQKFIAILLISHCIGIPLIWDLSGEWLIPTLVRLLKAPIMFSIFYKMRVE